jgi:glucose/arabinose dehydrogenase
LLLGAISVMLAACGSSDADGSFGSGPPAVDESAVSAADPDVVEATTPTMSAPPATADTEPSATTSVSGPLLEPAVVELFEIGSFDQPVGVTHRPGNGELYVIEQPGRVIAVTDLSSEVVLDITDLTAASGEQGLLGLAFHPTADLAYAYFTDTNGNTVVAEFTIDPSTGAFDRDSLREVLAVDQPYSNHNGGQLAFGPDQLLYVGLGDGGSGADPQRHALDLTSRLGKILRIDPVASGIEPFTVPADNPFAADPAADPTIWAYGLRNPWRFSFDPPTGDMWIADVGQGDFEEINRAVATDRRDAAKGTSFGWSALEGFEVFNDDQQANGAQAPVFVYDHADGRCSVTGGVVAHGDAIADLAGWYLFGDYCSGQIWALDPTADPAAPRVIEIAQLDALASIDEGPDRELYVVSNGGTIARLIAS